MKSMMNVGVIGCGRVAKLHMSVYERIKNADVVAVSDIDLGKAKILADKYGVNQIFPNHKDLLEVKDLDFVDVCTPTSTHADIVCDVAKCGHNTLVEKPMALSSAECERMISESKKYGVKLCVCHNHRFFSSIMQAKSMVDSGYYDIQSFGITWRVPESVRVTLPSWQLTPEEGGILWEGVYHSAYIQLFFLQNVKEVYAVGKKLSYPTYDNFLILLRTPKLSYGVIDYSLISKEGEKFCEILSTDGKRAKIDLRYDSFVDKSGKRPEGQNLYGEVRKRMKYMFRLVLKPRSFRPPSSFVPYHLGHLRLISSYIESLQNDSPPPVNPVEGKNTTKLLEAIRESLGRKKPILIK